MMQKTAMSNVLGMPHAEGLTPTGYELPENLSDGAWLDVGRALGRVRGSVTWWVGDWWAYGEHAYGERKAMVEAEDWEGPRFQTCMDAAMVCSAFTTSRRREALSFTAHREVLPLPLQYQDQVLTWAEEGKRSTREIRDEVKRIRSFLAQGWTQDQLDRKARAEAGECVVANMRQRPNGQREDEALLAWAEASDLFERIDRKTEWGNPFEMPGDGTREEVCDWFETLYLPYKRTLLKRIPTLRGKVLGCWCDPEPCHGHTIAGTVNLEAAGRGTAEEIAERYACGGKDERPLR
jgi:hypothetical protein